MIDMRRYIPHTVLFNHSVMVKTANTGGLTDAMSWEGNERTSQYGPDFLMLSDRIRISILWSGTYLNFSDERTYPMDKCVQHSDKLHQFFKDDVMALWILPIHQAIRTYFLFCLIVPLCPRSIRKRDSITPRWYWK